MGALTKRWRLAPLGLLLMACAASGPAERELEGEALPAMSLWEAAGEGDEACEEEDGCVTLLCGEGMCGIYRCEDVEWEPALLAYRGGIPPGSGPRRNRGYRRGVPRDGLPVFIIPWRFHDRRQQLPSELARLKILDPIKHHIFPRQKKLADWFRSKGLSVHEHTMVVERKVHDRIHRGEAGGAWNAHWREFMISKPGATQAEVWEQALEMILRFELSGPVVPYHWRVRSPAAPAP